MRESPQVEPTHMGRGEDGEAFRDGSQSDCFESIQESTEETLAESIIVKGGGHHSRIQSGRRLVVSCINLAAVLFPRKDKLIGSKAKGVGKAITESAAAADSISRIVDRAFALDDDIHASVAAAAAAADTAAASSAAVASTTPTRLSDFRGRREPFASRRRRCGSERRPRGYHRCCCAAVCHVNGVSNE